jgi:hypothetical protein
MAGTLVALIISCSKDMKRFESFRVDRRFGQTPLLAIMVGQGLWQVALLCHFGGQIDMSGRPGLGWTLTFILPTGRQGDGRADSYVPEQSHESRQAHPDHR